ncbi:unnamed protein product, partial [Timema podura]|nr:unnamed protein product [Timema podura]
PSHTNEGSRAGTNAGVCGGGEKGISDIEGGHTDAKRFAVVHGRLPVYAAVCLLIYTVSSNCSVLDMMITHTQHHRLQSKLLAGRGKTAHSSANTRYLFAPDVQKKLAAATYYKFYGPGRVVVRQGHRAEALYFILSGEVTVSITCWDGLIEEIVTSDVGTMRPGDMFGEVSLLHDIPRTATCTTATMVELLCLMKEDFANVLQVSLQHHWDDCKRAMQQFPYFNGWDEVAVRECCILSKLKSYGPD